ncbi:MAG: hypothetical protein MRK00_07370 [Nitrosomonas sp.]|nr:hypothetical protein [Nitrosomonas sp.]
MITQINFSHICKRPWKLRRRLTGYALFQDRFLTMHGRWINPHFFVYSAIENETPCLKLQQMIREINQRTTLSKNGAHFMHDAKSVLYPATINKPFRLNQPIEKHFLKTFYV